MIVSEFKNTEYKYFMAAWLLENMFTLTFVRPFCLSHFATNMICYILAFRIFTKANTKYGALNYV